VTKKQIGTYIEEDVWDSLMDRSIDTGQPITRIVEDALRAYLKVPRKKPIVDKRRKKNVEA
jgi:hypothetical protein